MRHSWSDLLAGQGSGLQEGQHEIEGATRCDFPAISVAAAQPQQVGTNSSQWVGAGHPDQPDLRCDVVAHILLSEMDVAVPARLVWVPPNAVLNTWRHQQELPRHEQPLLAHHEGGAAAQHPHELKILDHPRRQACASGIVSYCRTAHLTPSRAKLHIQTTSGRIGTFTVALVPLIIDPFEQDQETTCNTTRLSSPRPERRVCAVERRYRSTTA